MSGKKAIKIAILLAVPTVIAVGYLGYEWYRKRKNNKKIENNETQTEDEKPK
jgi:H+/gluconate symporter-like permease